MNGASVRKEEIVQKTTRQPPSNALLSVEERCARFVRRRLAENPTDAEGFKESTVVRYWRKQGCHWLPFPKVLAHVKTIFPAVKWV